MKKFCESLREHTMEITNLKNTKMRSLTEIIRKCKKKIIFLKKNFKITR